MQHDPSEFVIEHNAAAKRFEIKLDDQLARLDYGRSGSDLILLHTEVPPAWRDRGIAAKLTRAALDHARDQHLGVVPLCPYVASYLRRHPEYHDLIQAEWRTRVLDR